MRIAYFGLPLGALLLAQDGHDLVFVAICRSDALGLRRAQKQLGNRLLVTPKATDTRLHARVAAAQPDLLVSWFWTTRIPPALLSLCPQGAFGVHPSLLPRHRGPDPYAWAILCGDEETGVTAHRLDAAYDTGAVLGQKRLRIDPTWDAWRLARALDRPSLVLLRETAARFATGDPPHEIAQDETLATSAPMLSDEDAALHFAKPTEHVLRCIRALAPTPAAYFELGGELITVTRAERSTYVPASLDAGEAFIYEGRAVVRTSDGAIVLLAGEDEEGRALDAAGLVAKVERARA